MSLTRPDLVRSLLQDVTGGTVHFDIRMLENRMPVYYICRQEQDFWQEIRVVVEDLYGSPGYPLRDDRFVRLLLDGHECSL